ncbi:MAG: hypothetical protein P4M11_10070, partial [Candidatus Pacebacteria bacterium]|nr:hypothetical protein [Candidatus Paceibacterota bacterium]
MDSDGNSPQGDSTGPNLDPVPKLQLSAFRNIKDRSNQEVSLCTVMEKRDDRDEVMYNMICEKRQKVYEVKTKYLPSMWPAGYK